MTGSCRQCGEQLRDGDGEVCLSCLSNKERGGYCLNCGARAGDTFCKACKGIELACTAGDAAYRRKWAS